ncbi:MAG: TRIC cation channel family protein [Campylobacterota bacterium]|nr:TRIC cation channel family protein [Campylobacterota bacterium]
MFEITEYIGIIAFAMSGFFVAIRNELDLLGILIATFLTAFGGGVVRDVIVGKTPYPFGSDEPAIMVITVMIIMILFGVHRKPSIENRALFIFSDSIGLVSFSVTGALIALEAGYNLTGILTLSFITAVGGGIMRDVILNEVPFVFKTGFYGTVSLLIGFGIYLLDRFEIMSVGAMLLLFATGVAIRVVAFYQKWSIKVIK